MRLWSHLWDFYYRCFPVCLDCLLPHLPAANLNSPFMYLSEGNFRGIFCIARGISHKESDTTERLSLFLRQRLHTHSPLSAPTLLMVTGPLIWVMHTALQGEDHALQPPWLLGESVRFSSEGKHFTFLGAFLKRGTECPVPTFPRSLPLSRRGGRWPRDDHGEHSTTYCNCPGKRRPTSPERVARGWKRRGGILAILEEEHVGSLITRGRRGWRMNLRYCSWHPVDAHSQARGCRRALRLMGSGRGRGSEDVCSSQAQLTSTQGLKQRTEHTSPELREEISSACEEGKSLSSHGVWWDLERVDVEKEDSWGAYPRAFRRQDRKEPAKQRTMRR